MCSRVLANKAASPGKTRRLTKRAYKTGGLQKAPEALAEELGESELQTTDAATPSSRFQLM